MNIRSRIELPTMRKILFLFSSLLAFSSCSTKKEILYFQDIEKIKNFEAIEQFEPKIEVNDVLRITVSSLNEEVVEPFKMEMNNQSSGGGGGNNAVLNGYLVDAEGNIQFPVLGEVSVKDKTRGELEEMLTTRIRDYVTDAVVQVRIVNFKVTVLGEVASQGVLQIPDERVSMPELIAMAGGITYSGKRHNILVIRDNDGKKTYGYVDITNADIFKNPYYFLKQNDIVYVEPTYRQVKSAGFITNYTGFFSLITSIAGLIFIFTR